MRAVRELFEAGTATGATDGELLQRFASRRDEGAFAALVERHGPMVLRVCRAELGDHHDALDAFQAVFLVLARKGGSLWVGDSLGPWLHRVARRASGRARRAEARRLAAERRAAESAPAMTVSSPNPDRDETAAVIHAEVDRLPEPFRAAVILCDLEGLTCDEAAARLGSPAGTVASRLSRGRGRLRDRLRRRGLDPGEPFVPGPILALPTGLADATASAAARFVTLSSSAAPTGAAVILALGVLRAMTWRTWWKFAAAALALAASTSGVVALAARSGGPAQEPPAKAEAPKVKVETVTVGPASFQWDLEFMGALEATNREPVKSPLTIIATIESILPHGTRVKKGDPVVVFDPSALKEASARWRANISEVQMELKAARETHNVAVLALREYEKGIYLSQKAAAAAEVKITQEALAQSTRRAERLRELSEQSRRRLEKQGDAATPADLLADQEIDDRAAAARITLMRDRLATEQAASRLDSLEKDAQPKELKVLQAEANKAETRVRFAERKLEKAQAEESALNKQLEDATARSPIDGVVTEPASLPGHQPIGPGTPAQPGKVLVHVQAPDGHLFVAAKVPEEQITMVRKGQDVTIDVDRGSSVQVQLDGVVETIHPLPDSNGQPFNPRFHTVEIGIKPRPPGAAAVRIHAGSAVYVMLKVHSLEGTLAVPTDALVFYDGAHHAAVRRDDGSIEWREVETGLKNHASIEIRSGLKPGEAIVADPYPLLSDDQRRRVSIAPPPPPPPSMEQPIKQGGFQ